MKKIVFCTMRDNKGATGGPGGVLFLQKSVLGNSINGIACKYWFNVFTPRLGPIKRFLNSAIFCIRVFFNRGAYFFTHDIYSARILALFGCQYSMVFHHQGPLVQEMLNLGHQLSAKKIRSISAVERIAFTKAKTLHFPSNGAAAMYFENPYANCLRTEVNVQPALYNIIPVVSPEKPQNFLLDADDNCLTFFSLGTLTEAKGQDLAVKLIGKIAGKSKKPIRYILVGRGPLKVDLLNSLEKIKEIVPSFSYHYFEGMSHDTVMFIHKISDVYIMLHRISIFDFATLEAMSQKSAIILSKVGGNIDFQKNGNVLFSEDIDNNENLLLNADLDDLKNRNMEVFQEYFSVGAFLKQYSEFFKKYL